MQLVTQNFKKLAIAVVMLTAGLYNLHAQNEPIIAHYIYHTNVFNPAVPGNTRDFYLGALARQQWVGFSGAPSTQLLNAYGFIPKIKGGIGLVFTNDMLGKERATALRVSYAYSQKLTHKATLSFGLGIGFLNLAVKGDELIYQEQNGDQSAILTPESKFKAYLNAGLEFSGYNFTAGFAVTNLDQSLKKATVYKLPRHYFAYAKYSWDINSKINLTPSVFVRSSAFTTQAEINLTATFRKRIIAGLFYRTIDAGGVMLGVHITRHLLASYSYDFDFGTLRSYQTGSHELTLVYRFDGFREKRVFYKSARYMN